MSFPKVRKFLVHLLITLASLGAFVPIAVMFLLSGALVVSEGNPLFPPEMNAARVPLREFVIGDLGGAPVEIPRYFASYVEYDGDPAPRVRIVVAPINPRTGVAMKDESGSVRTSIQGQGCGAHAAA